MTRSTTASAAASIGVETRTTASPITISIALQRGGDGGEPGGGEEGADAVITTGTN